MRSRRGATAVEFAILMPVFFVMLSAIIDSSWLYWKGAALELAVHDGCREGSLRDPGIGNADMATVIDVATTGIQTHMNSRGVPCEDCDITVTAIATGTEDAIQCDVEWDWTPVVGLVDAGTIKRSTTMRLEMQR